MKLGLVGIDQANNEIIKTLKESNDILITGFYNVYDSFLSDLSFPNLRQFSEFELLLEDSDALFFCDSLDRYFEFVISAMKQGKHILLNTIYGVAKERIDQLFKLSKEANVNIQILQTLRFNPLTDYSMRNISAPYYIDIKRMNALPDNKEMVFNHLTDDVALILQYIGGKVKRISTRIAPQENDFYDFLSVRIEFDNSVEAGLRYLFLTEKTSLKLDVFDEGVTFSLDYNRNICKTYKRKGASVVTDTPLFDVYNPILKEFSAFGENCKQYNSSSYKDTFRDLDIASAVMKIWDNLNL